MLKSINQKSCRQLAIFGWHRYYSAYNWSAVCYNQTEVSIFYGLVGYCTVDFDSHRNILFGETRAHG